MDVLSNFGSKGVDMSVRPECDDPGSPDLLLPAALRQSPQHQFLSYQHRLNLVRNSALLGLRSGYGTAALFSHSLEALVNSNGTNPYASLGNAGILRDIPHRPLSTMTATDPISSMRLLYASGEPVGRFNLCMGGSHPLNYPVAEVGREPAQRTISDFSNSNQTVASLGPPADQGIQLLGDVALEQLKAPEVNHANCEHKKGAEPSTKEKEEEESDAQKREKRIYRHESFVEKLYRLLIDLEGQGKESIASFTSDGLAFCVHEPEKFVKDIVPKYFRHRKMSSFHRQLLLYKFDRVRDGPDRGSFRHKFFRRGHADLLKHIERDDKNDKLPIGYQKVGQRT